MSVLWAGNMRGPQIQSTVSRLVLLLLLLLSGLTRTVLCQEEDADANGETLEDEIVEEEAEVTEGEVEAPEEGTTDPTANGLDTAPTPTVTDVPDYGANGDEHGSGASFDGGSAEGTTYADYGTGATPSPDDPGLDLLLIAIPVALVVLVIAIIVCGIFIYRNLTSKNRHSEMRKEDLFLDDSTEKVPMPMFEEDVPSVLELEMDQLDGWMKKDGETIDLN